MKRTVPITAGTAVLMLTAAFSVQAQQGGQRSALSGQCRAAIEEVSGRVPGASAATAPAEGERRAVLAALDAARIAADAGGPGCMSIVQGAREILDEQERTASAGDDDPGAAIPNNAPKPNAR
ncbi:hypothetical protein [Azospirillum sp. SYSU D00513]|uniref:hypothetical protein n=1 Tax=Azospirillum sp. SYSU D00513 TaxID=2812561 RepID=UPI001A9767DF|nr:hypothetical protein [Azospirillum sp. SYSU D00513]